MAYKTLKQIEALPEVDYISDERNNGDGIWIYLKKGFWNPELETHCIHEDTVKKINQILSLSIKPCNCDRCK